MNPSITSLLCRFGFHRRRGREVRREAGGWGSVCRHCGIAMIKPDGKAWRIARDKDLFRDS
jgi:hypothetical protein